MKKRAGFIALMFVASVASAAQDAPQSRPTASLAPPPDAPPIRTTPAGPYEVVIESDPALPTHTIYRPKDLSSFQGKSALPVVSWGNGACANAGLLFQVFLTQVASHGYLVISIGPKDAPLPAFARPRDEQPPGASAPRAPANAPASRDQQLVDAIDWAVRENEREGSAYRQRLNPQRIAVMGQSCGGLQTIAVSGDPRITTLVLWNSGTFPAGADSIGARLSNARKEQLAQLKAPIAYFIGGPSDIAYPNAEDDFKRIATVAAFKGNLNVGHGGTFRHPGAGWFGEVGVAWLDWQLKGDQTAARYFVGTDCTLCTNPIWAIEKKGIQ
ncbi:dienelactone hydrolase [Povalibacter uvarum]|uniref:Dienelactone hydrolase n=1 Tax=Povalibacter uvarum TaxID=732238 RepID=A0A841HPD9_9GAMM|nr:hypothetical protein [Povalibacter uvarum]MBB6093795.1 dienelactone hydrolase [Povalibacter uvarum]